MTLDIDHLRSWIGTTRETQDEVSTRLANMLAAVLDEPGDMKPGDAAPIGIHWCLSPEVAPMQRLGPDGHPARGGFLPPVPLPRRMWAGGDLVFHGDFRVGDTVRRVSRVADVSVREGRSGTLCFVDVRHEYHSPRGLALSERHDIVYRAAEAPAEAPAGNAAPESPLADPLPLPDAHLSIEATPVLLMRYSAVTFNGHRIHYDRDYCRDVENYPGLIVHGPLQATCLLRMASTLRGGLPTRFTFRGTAPLFDGAAFSVNALAGQNAGTELWIADTHGRVTMRATAR